MQIIVNSDNQITGSEDFSQNVKVEVEGALARFATWLTRVEVHLTVEGHGGRASHDNKRCLIEARPAGLRPMSVSHDAPTLDQAVTGASHKMQQLLESNTAKMRDADRHPTSVVEPDSDPDSE